MKDLFSVAGKVAVVTGGSRGIGEMIAAGYLANGAKVYITSRKAEACDATAKRLSEQFGGECISLPADMSNLAGIEAFAAALNAQEDHLDILVNNAGITRDNLTLRMKEEEWNEVINLNLSTTFFLTKEILRFMIKNRFGRIINISSVVGSSGNLGQANYAASKAGLEGMTKSIALEVASRGITANCIAPGLFR